VILLLSIYVLGLILGVFLVGYTNWFGTILTVENSNLSNIQRDFNNETTQSLIVIAILFWPIALPLTVLVTIVSYLVQKIFNLGNRFRKRNLP